MHKIHSGIYQHSPEEKQMLINPEKPKPLKRTTNNLLKLLKKFNFFFLDETQMHDESQNPQQIW